MILVYLLYIVYTMILVYLLYIVYTLLSTIYKLVSCILYCISK